MPTKKILESHPASVLKKEISMTNIKGYSKLKKAELVDLMMKPEHKDRFSHIEMARPKISKKEQAKNEDAINQFIADGEAKNKVEDKAPEPPKKSKRRIPKKKGKTITVTKADGTKKELKLKDKKKKRAEIKVTSFSK